MRVDKVNFNNFKYSNLKNSTSNNFVNFKTSKAINKDTFAKNNAVSFGEYHAPWRSLTTIDDLLNDEDFQLQVNIWGTTYSNNGKCYKGYPKRERDILKASEEEVKELADAICMFSMRDLTYFCNYSYPKKFLGVTYGTDLDLMRLAYARLDKYVKENKKEIKDSIQIVHNIEKLKIDMMADVTKQKEMLSSVLLDPIKLEDKVEDTKVPNGILIYGSNNAGKEEIHSWLKEKTGLRVKAANYNEQNPQQAIDDFKYYLEEAEKIYQTTNIRTVLDLENFDKLLTNNTTPKNRRLIAQFKNISENASQKYHTTLLLKTDMPIEKFEPSAIGMHRFDVSLFMDEKEVTEKQNKMYQDAMDRLNYFMEKAYDFESRYMNIQIIVPSEEVPENADYLNFC